MIRRLTGFSLAGFSLRRYMTRLLAHTDSWRMCWSWATCERLEAHVDLGESRR